MIWTKALLDGNSTEVSARLEGPFQEKALEREDARHNDHRSRWNARRWRNDTRDRSSKFALRGNNGFGSQLHNHSRSERLQRQQDASGIMAHHERQPMRQGHHKGGQFRHPDTRLCNRLLRCQGIGDSIPAIPVRNFLGLSSGPVPGLLHRPM